MKDVTINIRAHTHDIDLIDRAANVAGKTRSAFIREYAVAEAMKVFEKPRALGQPCPVCGHVS